jgi:NAD+ synthase
MTMNERPADRLAIAVAQLNPIVGDVAGNLDRARAARAQAGRDGAEIVAFSELFIAGYPPEDLVLKPAFQAACRAAVETLARETADDGPAVLVGTPWVEDGKLYNAYVLLAGGRIDAIRFKVNLPNYGVFDEKRVFATGPVPGPVNFRGVRLGLPICEDTWTDWGDYENVVECLAENSSSCLMARPTGATKRTSASTFRSRASPRPVCRFFTSTRSAARTNWSSTVHPSSSMPTVRSHCSCRPSTKRW